MAKAFAADQHQSARHLVDEDLRRFGKMPGGHEDALRRMMGIEAPGEVAHIRDGNGSSGLQPLGLKIDDIEPELVLCNNSIHSTIAAAPEPLGKVAAAVAVAQRQQHVDDQVFEEFRRLRMDVAEQLLSQSRLCLQETLANFIFALTGVRMRWFGRTYRCSLMPRRHQLRVVSRHELFSGHDVPKFIQQKLD